MEISNKSIDSSSPWHELELKIKQFQPRRLQYYDSVNVLLLFWEDADIPVAEEARVLGQIFANPKTFNYNVQKSPIPSASSEKNERYLSQVLWDFFSLYGKPNNLIVLHYGGHGANLNGHCEWACKLQGGPVLNWTKVQPALLSAGCDLVFFLDCCYSGLAIRSHTSYNLEFLAATDKDQWTPNGAALSFPSFTKVLGQQLLEGLDGNNEITIPYLHEKMVRAESRLVRQPFYVPLGKGSEGKIKLKPFLKVSEEDLDAFNPASSGILPEQACHLELTLFRPMTSTCFQALLRWLTSDSPSVVRGLKLTQLNEARKITQLGAKLVEENVEDVSDPYLLSSSSREQIESLLANLRSTITSRSPPDLTDDEAKEIHHTIVEISSAISRVVEDCVSGLQAVSLQVVKGYGAEIRDLRSKIALRLKLLENGDLPATSSVSFCEPSRPGQRLRIGMQNNSEVLVEYYNYNAYEESQKAGLKKQVARISALYSEPKHPSFRILQGRGHLYESLHGQRYGFIFEPPKGKEGHKSIFLSDLIREGKTVPLDCRIKIAKSLCEALLNLHSVGWLHKNIRSENIIFFAKEKVANSSPLPDMIYDLEEPYIIGFDCSRTTDAETRLSTDFTMKDNIYRHPERWGHPIRFERHHDLFALGILLVEMGRWKMLPNISMDSHKTKPDTVKNPEALRTFLLGSNIPHLEHSVPKSYVRAVVFCLEQRYWNSLEEWQYQKLVRHEVLEQLHCSVEMRDRSQIRST